MDELRIAIDSLKPTAQDLLVMLGDLRYRLEPRLNAADITLRWDIDVASGLRPMSAEHVADLTRIVQEGIANAMKHARATELRLKVEAPAAGGLRVTLMDNGRGFDPNRLHHGEGLTSMLKRAHKIGASLDITSEPGGTCIAVTLGPLAKTDPPAATFLPVVARNSPVANFTFRTLARKTAFHGRFRTASRACPPG
jgi:signal transduction histidine kinase